MAEYPAVSVGVIKLGGYNCNGVTFLLMKRKCAKYGILVDKGSVSVKDKHVAVSTLLEPVYGHHHRMARAHSLGLENGVILAVQVLFDDLVVEACYHADICYACVLTGSYRPVQHGETQNLKHGLGEI